MADLREIENPPRLPLEGSLDLTYRCNNACRHCWLRLPRDADEQHDELATAEVERIVDEARALGCRRWLISGGEPMLRPDFAELFDRITAKAVGYSLNTNGTLITPGIARLMKRRGMKMVALYGATPEVYEHVTRNPGGFEALMQGLAYLREAGAGFVVQLAPMRANWHQFAQMEELARSLSEHYRVGVPWVFETACGTAARRAGIAAPRRDPRDAATLAARGPADDDRVAPRDGDGVRGDGSGDRAGAVLPVDDRLHAACIERRRAFHVDPYGGMTFCSFVKDPELRYDLRRGSVAEAWEQFIPSLADRVRGGREYLEGCAVCDLRDDCRWCDVYGYLEHGRHGARVEYLCEVARESRAGRAEWAAKHRRFYEIAGVTVRVDSDLPFSATTFHPKFAKFAVAGPGSDLVAIHHHFGLPDLGPDDLGELVHRKSPWAVYRKRRSWIYLGTLLDDDDSADVSAGDLYRVAVFNDDHSCGHIYTPSDQAALWERGGIVSLTMLSTDQMWIGRLLADRQACYLHCAAAVIDGVGLVFAGHSTAGKSTTMELLQRELGDRVEILCDDRNIVRRWPDGYRVHGTWSHGSVPHVSSSSAPLGAILLVEKAQENRLVRLDDRKEVALRLLPRLVRPHGDAIWWRKSLALVESMTSELPFYEMRFDRSGAIVAELGSLAERLAAGRGVSR